MTLEITRQASGSVASSRVSGSLAFRISRAASLGANGRAERVDAVYERGAGIDISKVDLKVCMRVSSADKRRRGKVRTFTSLT